MKLKNILIPIFILLFSYGYAQKNHSKSFGFISDNDVFISLTQDQYYTNGLTLVYSYLSKSKKENQIKKIHSLRFGQYMYTPFRPFVPNKANQDRPFAGYLFADFSTAKFYKNKSAFKITYQLGVLGPDAKAENIQRWYHGVFGLPPIAGWEYQIQNQFGLNINALYIKNLGFTKSNKIDLNAVVDAKIGTIFNDFSFGFVSRISLTSLNSIANTVLFNSNINAGKTNHPVKEFYVFINPKISYVAYNATIQGSMFNNDSPLTFGSKPIKASLKLGLKWTSNRFNYGYSITYLTKALKNDKVTAHKYGTFTMIYRFQ